MAAPTCTVSGTLTDAAGAAKARALVRARVLDDDVGSVLSGVAVSIEAVTVVTDAAGEWSIVLPQGASVRLEIPSAGVDHVGTIPDASTLTFDTLFQSMTPYGAETEYGAA